MTRPFLLTNLWLLLGLGILGYAALTGQTGLLAGAALLVAGMTWPRGGRVRWAAPLASLAGFLTIFALRGSLPGAADLLGALLVTGGLAALTAREQMTGTKLTWTRRTVEALQGGSERLVGARSAEAISRAGVEILHGLGVAPHVAFVAYRQGTPVILAGRGAYEAHVQRPILPSDDSRSVQADHWVAGEVLALLDRGERGGHHIAGVYDGAGQHLGMLVLARPRPDFGADEVAVTASFARLLGAQLGQWQAIRDLREANDLTLRSLGAALERRDDDTGGHTVRVVGTSVRLAQHLGWDDDRVGALRWGAYLHDLGKLAIPDRILHKRGPLDPEERRVIQTHAALGYDMLQDLHFLPAGTLDLVRYHHERWDGGGYPAGLRGENIPETARLFAIIDVYDALTNARPYKPAWTRERALNEIRSQSGRQFDPQYVEAFLQLMAEQDDVRLVV